ncbi:TetR family transcriptional regulator, partial [Streptomyces sp. SID3915]|nr:TetR family transcriptional regulator [Streptomyces sp. SID3915]
MGAAGRKVARTVETTRTSEGEGAAPAAAAPADRPR